MKPPITRRASRRKRDVVSRKADVTTLSEANGRAEWERLKAARRNLTPQRAVRECDALCNLYRGARRPMADFLFNLPLILRTLRAKKIPFVLTGAHGIAVWTGRPRATHDIDILVKAGRNHARAVKAMKELFPELVVRPLPGVTAFFFQQEVQSVVDVSYPHRADLEETLASEIWVEDFETKYRIPSLEAALANKYGAMLALSRDIVKRGQDVVDFSAMVKHAQDESRSPIDLTLVAKLGELVWPGGGGVEIVRLIQDVQGDRIPTLHDLGRPRQ